jgi:hypothetical protein
MCVRLIEDGDFGDGTSGPTVEDIAVEGCHVPAPPVVGANQITANGLGSGIYVDLKDSTPFGYQIKRIFFSENEAWKGKGIYMIASQLAAAVTISEFSFTFAAATERDGTLMGGMEGATGE